MIEKTILNELLEYIKKDEFWIFRFSSEDKEKILSQVKEGLFNKGIFENKQNKYLYAASTIKKKKIKNQPYDRVTLKDSGNLYNSLTVLDLSNRNDFATVIFSVKNNKFDYADYLMSVKYFPNYIHLNSEEIKKIIIEKIKEKIIEKIKQIKRY